MTALSPRFELPGASPPIFAAPRSRRTGARARLACRWPTPLTPVISAVGDIDASNADDLTDYAVMHISGCSVAVLVLDLSGLEFFGVEGYRALHRVSVCSARAGVGLAVVPGPAVTRVLRHCDRQGTPPTADTVDAATNALSQRSRGTPRPQHRIPAPDGRCRDWPRH